MQQTFREAPRQAAPRARPARILVVDHDPGLRALCSWVLRSEGFRVTEAADGREGLARAVSDPPDLVLLDVCMPILDGFGMAVALRTIAPTRDLPLVFMSGEPEAENRGAAVGALGFLAKPIEPATLVEFVQRVLARVGSRRPLAREGY